MILGTTKEPKSSKAASCPIDSWILGLGVICWLPLLLQWEGWCMPFTVCGKPQAKFPLNVSGVPDRVFPLLSLPTSRSDCCTLSNLWFSSCCVQQTSVISPALHSLIFTNFSQLCDPFCSLHFSKGSSLYPLFQRTQRKGSAQSW